MQTLGRASASALPVRGHTASASLCRLPASAKPLRSQRLVTRVAAIDEQQPQTTTASAPEMAAEPMKPHLAPISAQEMSDLQLAELDASQEQLLSWMMNVDEEDQEEDLDEMVDYDEFGDEEYEELFEDVEEMLSANEDNSQLKVADKVMGTVYELDDDGAYVEIGQKASGFVPLTECSFAKLKSPYEVLRVGMTREFVVVDEEDEYGQTILSLAAMEATIFWERIRQLQSEDVTVFVKVDSANKGGLLVKYGPYDGFVPVSQFGSVVTVDMMDSLIGYEIPVKFLEVDEERERLVFSNKRASMAQGAELQGYKVGDVVQGVVSSVKPYGAFVDLGGVTGLLHVSQISHERITGVDKILQEGDKLKVMVLSQDRDRGRVTLSTKKLEPTPGDMLRDPQRVFENADYMAETFRKRVEAAELSARSDPSALNPMAAVLDPSEMNPMYSSVDYPQVDPAAGENYTY
ncbi:plastid ribosomal protein S1 [Dunaliella salina]|uniref:Plastid ribosomal protein S1 n=1 Tax=Dunaliella salina TaxID=3046 RepID=A0ABQ7G6N2_DUNSA|nr:plastid ribosomal protein S1 [Dunaliella salina]|eukprot:KAF5830247.1 plastid ribosomal protein S1 [Dunaliella salina]